jgi:hypothetical protein
MPTNIKNYASLHIDPAKKTGFLEKTRFFSQNRRAGVEWESVLAMR